MRAVPSADLERRAEVLKERIYITFSALAVTVALTADAAHLTVGRAALILAVSVIGTLLAVFVADVVAHITVHTALPDRHEVGHMALVAGSALGVLVLPLLLLAAAALRWWPLADALVAADVVLAATLTAAGFLAARRLRLPLGARLLVLLAEAALGSAVIALELAVH